MRTIPETRPHLDGKGRPDRESAEPVHGKASLKAGTIMHNIDRRSSGILLHITSLPSAFGIGDLGPEAYRFADFLAETRQRFWQILPLNPTDPEHGNSPYHSMSAFAGHPLLLSPEGLLQEGLLVEKEVNAAPPFPDGFVDFKNVLPYKKNLFQAACSRFREERGIPNTKPFLNKTHNGSMTLPFLRPLSPISTAGSGWIGRRPFATGNRAPLKR